jgi:hypothetical protein
MALEMETLERELQDLVRVMNLVSPKPSLGRH